MRIGWWAGARGTRWDTGQAAAAAAVTAVSLAATHLRNSQSTMGNGHANKFYAVYYNLSCAFGYP